MDLGHLEVDLLAETEVQGDQVPLKLVELSETEVVVRADLRQQHLLPEDSSFLSDAKDHVQEVKDPLIDPRAHRLRKLFSLLQYLLLLLLEILELFLLLDSESCGGLLDIA